MNRDVMAPVLSLDSYFRGSTDVPLPLQLSDQNGQRIGNVQIIAHKEAASVGFYAVAYQEVGATDDEGVTIAYRGTDAIALDAPYGWSTGFRLSNMPQAREAMQFFQDVTGTSAFDGVASPDIMLTGHSLGGGLAGLVGSIAGRTAILFDHMPFGPAAIATVAAENATRESVSMDGEYSEVPAPGLALIKAYHVDGEALEIVRSGTAASTASVLADAVVSLLDGPEPGIMDESEHDFRLWPCQWAGDCRDGGQDR